MSDREILLRPHHGLCLRFFEGKGYSADFVKNTEAVRRMLTPDARVRLTAGPDAVCRCCPRRTGPCTSADRYDRQVLAKCGLEFGETLTWSRFAQLVTDRILRCGSLAEICGDCRWFPICSKKEA